MSRLIQTGSTPAKRRHAHRRSSAEVLRLLATRPGLDAETRDMIAFLAFNLRQIYDTIEESVRAWEDRNYWKKAEALRHRWRWSLETAEDLERHLLDDQWAALQPLLISLIPHFSDITIGTTTRNADWWCGAYTALRRKRL